jgi:hypothetical protein
MNSIREQRWAEWNEDVIIAFEKPRELNNPDIRDDVKNHIVLRSYLVGCRSCQQVRSKCGCSSPNPTEILIYDREAGLNGRIWRKHFTPKLVQPKTTSEESLKIIGDKQLTPEELGSVLPDVGELVAGSGSEDGIHKEPHEYLGASKAFLDHITSPETHAKIYFTYPQDKYAEVANLFSRYGKKLTVRPLQEPKPGTKTEQGLSPSRGGVSASIQFPMPKDDGLVKQLMFLYPKEVGSTSASVVILGDSKLALHLILISGYTQDSPYGPKWD